MRFTRKLLLLIAILLIIGMSGCISNYSIGNSTRKESDAEYLEMMKKYMEDKYSTTFDTVEYILPSSGVNTGMEINVLVLRDADGTITNVRAKFGTPYNYYDDYVKARTAAKILSEIDAPTDGIDEVGLYVTVKNITADTVDVSPENINSITVVAKVSEEPTEANMKALYDVYKELCDKGYGKVYFLVGFVADSSDFDAAVKNYNLHGKSKWSDYTGEFFAHLHTTSTGLSFEEFKASIEK